MSRRNHTTSNQTTGVDTRIDLLATEATQNQVLQAIKGINISAEIGEITVESSDTITHTKLTTLNTTVANKHLNYETDSVTIVGGGDSLFNVSDADTHTTLTVISNTLIDKHLDYQTDSVTVSVMPALNFTKDSVNVVEEVHSITYDLEIYGPQLYATSQNYTVGVDPNGRDGWFFQNTATTGGTNNYWYSNSQVPQNQMTKAQIECVYIILSLDRVQPNIVLPFVAMYSLPTGTGDILPTFAHSSWTYTIPANSVLNAGEVIMLTIGDNSKVANIRPELRRISLTLNNTNGDALETEIIGYISLNTDSGVKPLGGIQYLLQNAGFYYSITEKVVDYQFVNSVDRKIKDAFISEGVNTNIRGYNGTSFENVGIDPGTGKVLVSDSATTSLDGKIYNATEVDTEAIKVYTVNSDSSSLVQIQGYNGTDWENVTATMGTLQVSDFKIHNATETDTEAIKVYTVNNISGFALESDGNLASIKTNTDKIKSDTTNTDAIQVQVKNSSIPVTGTFFQTTQPVSGTVAVSNTGFNVNNFPASQAVTGTFFQTTQPVSGTVAVSNTGFNVNNFPETQPVSGTVNVNTISGFAVESGGNLASIKSNTDRIKSDTTNADAIQVQVKNSSIPVTGSFFQTTQPVSGTVAVSNTGFDVNNFPASQTVNGTVTVNTISGFAVESGGNLASIKTNTDKIKSDTTNTDAIQVQVKNSSIPVSGNVTVNTISGFAVESGGNLASIKTNTDRIKSDTTNTDAIQVQVKNSSIPVTGSFFQTTQPVSGTVAVSNTGFDVNNFPASTNSHTQAYDPSGGGGYFDITSTSISSNVSALDVAVKNTVPVTGTFYQEIQPVSGTVTVNTISGFALETGGNLASIKTNTDKIKSDTTNTDAIQVQVKNSSIPVTGTITANFAANQRVLANVYDKQDNGITSTNHTLNKYGLDTTSALATTDMTNRYLLTSTLNGAKQSLDVNVANTVSIDTSSSIPVTGDITIDNESTTNFDSATGLNVYQILPKIKQYTIGGFDEQNSVYRLFGLATPGGINTTTTDFGLANSRVHYGGTSSGIDRVAYIDYVDPDGDLVENSGPYTFNTTYAILPSMIAPIKFRLTSNLAGGQAVYISITANSSVTAVAGQDQNQYCIGTFTVPNGYIGYISHLSSTVGSATNIQIVKWDVNGVRSVVYRFNNTGIASHTAGYEGGLGGIFYAGETIAFSNQTAVASKSCFANMILKSIL